MEPIPLIPELNLKPCSDTSHILREEFQEFLGQNPFPEKIAENLSTFKSKKFDLKYCGTEVKNSYKYSTLEYKDILDAESAIMRTQVKYLREKVEAEKNPLQMKINFPKFDESIVEKYSLLQPQDLLPHNTEQILYCRLELKDFPLRKSCSFMKEKSAKAELMTDIKCCDDNEIKRIIPYAKNNMNNVRSLKYEPQFGMEKKLKKHSYIIHKSVFVAKPKKIMFYNYEKHTVYEKPLFLLNVSAKSQAFEIPDLPKPTNFTIKTTDVIRKVAPGMCAQLTINFSSHSLMNCQETLVINVHDSQAIVVDLISFRDAPLVRGLVCHGEQPLKEEIRPALDTNSALNYTIDCGACFLGYVNNVKFVFRNFGGKGTFFILGEEDWVCRDINSITADFKMNLQDFTICPVYFELSKDESHEINIEFRPTHKGLCLDKIYILCDNNAYKEIDLIGDCLIYGPSLLHLEESLAPLKQVENMRYSLQLGQTFANQMASATFSVKNTSHVNIQYEWRKSLLCECDYDDMYIIEDEWIRIKPDTGVLKPASRKEFEVNVSLDSKQPGNYVFALCLYVLNLPNICLHEDSTFKFDEEYVEAKSEIQLCNIQVNEVEVHIENVEIKVSVWPEEISMNTLLSYQMESNAEKIRITNETLCSLNLNWNKLQADDYEIIFVPTSFEMESNSSTVCRMSIIPHSYKNIETECTLSINGGLEERKIMVKGILERPKIIISERFLNFGIVRKDSDLSMKIRIQNQSEIEIYWNLLEYKFDFGHLDFVEMPDSKVDANCGQLCHKGSYYDVLYTLDTSVVQKYFSILIFFITHNNSPKIESGFTFVLADVQLPQVSIQDVHYKEQIFKIDEEHVLNETLIREFYIHNYSPFETTYTWGEPTGLNKQAVAVTFEYNTGKLYASARKLVKISVTFHEIGSVKDCYVPCAIETLDEPIFLQLCCQIRGPHVVIRIPANDRYVDVPWPIEYTKCEMYEDLILLEEQELSIQENHEHEEQITNMGSKTSSTNMSEAMLIDENNKLLSEDSKVLQYYPEDIISYLKNIEIQAEYESSVKRIDSSITEETVASKDESTLKSEFKPFSAFGSETSICEYAIEFHNVPCKQVTKKSIDITNNMRTSLSFSVSVKHFKTKTVQKTKFDDILVNMKLKTNNIHSDQLSEHGIFVTPQPENGELNGKSTVTVDVVVYAETWGWYLEEVAIEIDGLPTFYLNLIVQVTGFPIEYPVMLNNIRNLTEPQIKFGNLFHCCERQKRIVTLYNSSAIPCTLVWHIFTKDIEDSLKSPINILIDIFGTSQKKSTNCRVKIMKYFGKQNCETFDLFTVEPKEIYIKPKATKRILVTIKPRYFEDTFEDFELNALLIGHVYIDEIYSNHSNFIIRNPDQDLRSTKISLSAHMKCPKRQFQD